MGNLAEYGIKNILAIDDVFYTFNLDSELL